MIDIVRIFQNTVEYKNFGANFLTASAIVTIILSFVKGYGIVKQGIDIWKKETGEKVSPIFFFYNLFFFSIFFIYGIEGKSIAITCNGSLFLFCIPILIGLKKYRGFSLKEIFGAGVMSLIIPAVFLFDKRQVVFAFSLVAAVAVIVQFKEIWKEKNFGAFSLEYMQTFFITSIFWGVYYTVTKNWLLLTLNIVETITLGIALILEKKWRKNRKTKRPSD